MIGGVRGEVGRPLTFEGYANDYDKRIRAVQFSLDDGETWTSYDTPDTVADKTSTGSLSTRPRSRVCISCSFVRSTRTGWRAPFPRALTSGWSKAGEGRLKDIYLVSTVRISIPENASERLEQVLAFMSQHCATPRSRALPPHFSFHPTRCRA